MEKQTPKVILNIPKCSNRLPITAELLSILTLPAEGILWNKSDEEYYLFSEKQWILFVANMKTTQSDKSTYFEYTRQGRDFMRGIYEKAGTVACEKDGIHLTPHAKKKIIQNKRFTIKVYR